MKHNYSKSQEPSNNRHVSPPLKDNLAIHTSNQENFRNAANFDSPTTNVSPQESNDQRGSARSTSASVLKQRIADYTHNNRPVATRVLQGANDNQPFYFSAKEIRDLSSKSFRLEDLSKRIESCLESSKMTLNNTLGIFSLAADARDAGNHGLGIQTQTSEFDDNHRSLKEKYQEKYSQNNVHPSIPEKASPEQTSKKDDQNIKVHGSSEPQAHTNLLNNKLTDIVGAKNNSNLRNNPYVSRLDARDSPSGPKKQEEADRIKASSGGNNMDHQPREYTPSAYTLQGTNFTHKLSDNVYNQATNQHQAQPAHKNSMSNILNVGRIEEQLHFNYNQSPPNSVEKSYTSETIKKESERVLNSDSQSLSQNVPKTQKETNTAAQGVRPNTQASVNKDLKAVPRAKKTRDGKVPSHHHKIRAKNRTETSEKPTSPDTVKTAQQKHRKNFIEHNKLNNAKPSKKRLSPNNNKASPKQPYETIDSYQKVPKNLRNILAQKDLGLTAEQIENVFEKLNEASRSSSPKGQSRPLNLARHHAHERSAQELKSQNSKRNSSRSFERPETEQQQKKKLTEEEQERLNNRMMAEAARRKLSKERALQEKIELEIKMSKAMSNQVFSSTSSRKSRTKLYSSPPTKSSFQIAKTDDAPTPNKTYALKPEFDKPSPENKSTIHKVSKKTANQKLADQPKARETNTNKIPTKGKKDIVRSIPVTPETSDTFKTGSELERSNKHTTLKKSVQQNNDYQIGSKNHSPRTQTPPTKRSNAANHPEPIPQKNELLADKKANFMTKKHAIDYVNGFLNSYRVKTSTS